MPTETAIRCRCGMLRGVAHDLSPEAGTRCVCYCRSCQAFANALATHADTLGPNGGTDVFQTSPARLELTAGLDQLACLRVTPKGPYRWYTRCCETPIANTLPTDALPFIALIHSCIDAAGEPLDSLLGPVRVRVMARDAIGTVPTLDAFPGYSVFHIAATIGRMLLWRLHGDHRRSPFFDPETHAPIAAPESLATAREQLASNRNDTDRPAMDGR